MKGSSTATRSRDNAAHNPFVKVKVEKPAVPRTAAAPPNGVEVSKASRERLLRVWRGFVKVGVGVLIFSGAMNSIVNPLIINPISRLLNPPAAAAVHLDEASARQVAAATVADWLTFNPQQLAAYRTVITGEFTGTGDATTAWAGSAWMAPDIVVPGPVVIQPGDQLAVTVTARVRIATPDKASQAVPEKAVPAGDPGNNPAQPAGYTVTSIQWFDLLVPLTSNGGTFTAAAIGPVFTDSTAPITTAPGPAADGEATDASKAWATSLFTAYAGTDPTALGYLTGTDLPMLPLNGQVGLGQVNNWTVQTAAEGETGRIAIASVTWNIPGTDLTVRQTYTVELAQQGQRWFATNLTSTPATGGTA